MGRRRPRAARRAGRSGEALTRGAEQGWRDLVATQRNAVVAAWERLTKDPLTEDLSCHALRGALGTVRHSGRDWVRRQCELKRGARLWFTVDEDARLAQVLEVHTHHPNQTK